VLWEMLIGKVPFYNFNYNQIIEHMALLNWRLPLPEKNKPLGKFMTQCWRKDPAEPLALAAIRRKFHQGEVEFKSCERVDWDNLREN
jgi:hypothetical protein